MDLLYNEVFASNSNSSNNETTLMYLQPKLLYFEPENIACNYIWIQCSNASAVARLISIHNQCFCRSNGPINRDEVPSLGCSICAVCDDVQAIRVKKESFFVSILPTCIVEPRTDVHCCQGTPQQRVLPEAPYSGHQHHQWQQMRLLPTHTA